MQRKKAAAITVPETTAHAEVEKAVKVFEDKYKVHFEIKEHIKAAGLTIRDIAVVIEMPPFTLAGKLNGYSPLEKPLAKRILDLCDRQIEKIAKQRGANIKIHTPLEDDPA